MEQFVQGVGNFFGNIGAFLSNPGFDIVLLLVLAVWWLVWYRGMKWPAAVATVVLGLLAIFLTAAFLTTRGLIAIGDTNRAYNQNCRYANVPCIGDPSYSAADESASSGGDQSGGVTYDFGGGGSGNGQGAMAGQDVVMKLRTNAIEEWVKEKLPNPRPATWLPKDQATTDIIPKDVSCMVIMSKNASKVDEVWSWACIDNNNPGVTEYTFTTNGFVVRDSRIFKISDTSKDGTEVFGTGDWKTCDACWTATVATATNDDPPTVTATDTPPADTAGSTGDTTGSNQYVVTDPTGATVRTPQNGVCSDGDPKTNTSISFGTTVTIVQTWPSFNIPGSRGLTSDGQCVHLSALTQK